MHAALLVDALKRLLKAQGITYAQIADGLRLSEASVKRMFSRRDFTLQRLEDTCRLGHIFGARFLSARQRAYLATIAVASRMRSETVGRI